jgi:RNA polymerase sigma-70 factor (ECF subfamily)
MEFRRLETSRRRGEDYLRYLQLCRLQEDPEASETEPQTDALRRCLEKLQPAEASLLKEKYADGQPLKDLAARLKATEGAIKVRLLRLREALKTCIEKRLAEEHRA